MQNGVVSLWNISVYKYICAPIEHIIWLFIGLWWVLSQIWWLIICNEVFWLVILVWNIEIKHILNVPNI